ncbi:HTH DNA binding protein [Mycobacterium phage Kimona]|uniref:Helix-turn-helix DNA binding protein n=1 Tax=Mycobacterium phage Kimona TaxID=2024295 RepID=A0A249XU92_9CAUD|nr:HTH DNA binding protein [Mycobacterium phage Kimona]ASZ75482.1 helix-turn-helix DNA binding protein [Mycobacterium phage Kimona]
MRKKHLKAALNAAQVRIDQLTDEATELKEVVDYLHGQNEELQAANVKLSDAANAALRANRELKAKLDRQNDLFGQALVQIENRNGPRRPNRRKLSKQDAEHIRGLIRAGHKQRDIASAYDVNPATVSRIARGIYHAA